MVFYFTARDGTMMYMGRDKHENEHLIKYGWPEDVWFHVDNLSSAHVYLRLPEGKSVSAIPKGVLEDCCQLVKANSIQGCKLKAVDVVYTPWENLQKTSDMVAGQVGYFDRKQVTKVNVEKDRDILRRLAKTKREATPDLAAERAARDRAEVAKNKEARRQRLKEEAVLKKKREEERELRSYKSLFEGAGAGAGGEADDLFEATEDSSAAVAYEDDFM